MPVTAKQFVLPLVKQMKPRNQDVVKSSLVQAGKKNSASLNRSSDLMPERGGKSLSVNEVEKTNQLWYLIL